MFENFSGKIIWSADGVSLDELLRIVDGDFPRDQVAIKLDRLFLTKYGLSSISEIQGRGIPVFADAKIVEIPSKVDEIVKLHLEYQPWMLNVMAGVCSTGTPSTDGLFSFANLCRDAGTKSCVVTVLTSKTDDMAKLEFGKSALGAVVYYTNLAINCGVTDIVCSPLEAKSVRKLGDISINTPGVRMPESDADDQARIMTPANALANGADRLVIGRDLSRNGKFSENFAKIVTNIKGGNFDAI